MGPVSIPTTEPGARWVSCPLFRDIASLEADAISEGYAEGFADGRAEVLPILADLISDLRGDYLAGRDVGIVAITDRAHARLAALANHGVESNE